jgi:hypothetical protein
MSAPSSGSKIPSHQCHQECDINQNSSVSKVAIECAPDIICSEITQQADGHFDFIGAIPINNQRQDTVIHREKQ